jgi:hypothetical protein
VDIRLPLNPFGFLYKKFRAGYRSLCFGEQSNYDFGHAGIIMEYSQVDQNKKIRGRYQHGWYPYAEKEFWINDFIPTYVWNRDMLHKANMRGFRNFVAIGSSWLYFLEILKNRGLFNLTEIREGSVEELWVYGSHSTETYTVENERIIDFLNRANNSICKSKLVLLYDLDYQKLSSSLDIDQVGIPIVSIGPRNSSFYSDAHFFNLFHLLTDSQLVITNYPTSIFCYALSLGRDVKWLKDKNFEEASIMASDFASVSLQELMRLDIVTALEFRAFAMSELGYESIKSPDQLRALFQWNAGVGNKMRILFSLVRSAFSVIIKIFTRPKGLGFDKV